MLNTGFNHPSLNGPQRYFMPPSSLPQTPSHLNNNSSSNNQPSNLINSSNAAFLDMRNNTSNTNSNNSKNSDDKMRQNVATAITSNNINNNQLRSSGSSNNLSQQQSQSSTNSNITAMSPAVITAAAAAINQMGITPSHPHYNQIVQQQIQFHQQQFQQMSKHMLNQNNNENVKKEPIIPMQTHQTSSNSNQFSHQLQTQQPQAPVHMQILKSNNNSSNMCSNTGSSSSYVPQVEAISPTPEDQKENSNIQEIKDKIISEICKVEKDFASTQYQLEILKKKQIEMEELKNKPIILDENSSKLKTDSTLTLAEKIYKENRVFIFFLNFATIFYYLR